MSAPTIGSFTGFESVTGSSTASVSAPTGVVEGDLVLIFIATYSSITSVTADDAGTELLLELVNYGGLYGNIWGRVATASEPASYGFTGNASADWRLQSGICDGADLSDFPTSVVADTATSQDNTTSSITVSELNLPADALMLGHVLTRASNGTIDSDGGVMTGLWATEVFSSRKTRSFEETPASGLTGTRTFNCGGTTNHTAGLLGIAPEDDPLTESRVKTTYQNDIA